jgi:hypothetical protein
MIKKDKTLKIFAKEFLSFSNAKENEIFIYFHNMTNTRTQTRKKR